MTHQQLARNIGEIYQKTTNLKEADQENTMWDDVGPGLLGQ